MQATNKIGLTIDKVKANKLAIPIDPIHPLIEVQYLRVEGDL
jgi:hypothetical protein